MSFAGLEELRPMAIQPSPPHGMLAFTHRPAGKVFELKFEYKDPQHTMRFVGTFGKDQPWAGHYIQISAYDEESARFMMQEKFGSEWSAIYKSDTQHTAEEVADVRRLGLKPLTEDMIHEAKQKAAKPFNVIEGVL